MPKEKNTFAKLRSQKNDLQNKLNMANRTICLQIDEIKKLNETLEIEYKTSAMLQDRVNVEVHENEYLQDRITSLNEEKNKFYKYFIKETKRRGKESKKCSRLNMIAFVMLFFVIMANVAYLVKG